MKNFINRALVAKKHLKLFFALFAMLALGVGNAWGAALGSGYEKVTNISSLTTGDKVVLYCDDASVGVTGWNSSNDATVAASGFVEYLVTVVSGGVTLKDESAGKYIAKPTGNHFKYNATAGTCSVNASGVIACNSRYLYQNGTYYRMYEDKSSSSSYKPFYVYKVVTTGGGETPDPTTYTIKWHTAKGVTTDVTLNEGATITKPATDPTMTDYEFMGWTASCDVAPDGADFTALTDFGTADSDKDFYAVFAKATTTGGGTEEKEFTFNITKEDFNTTSYAANNNEKTSTAKASDGSTMDVKWTSNQVMQSSSVMQWQKDKGYIYNSTDLGTITNIEITSTAGTFTKYINNSKQPTSNGTGGYFQIKIGGATGKSSNIKVTFTQTVAGGGTTTYSDYITTCASGIEYIELGDDFKWSTASAEVTIDATDNVFPILTNTHNVPVTYSSSDETIASIAADGTVTLNKEGSVTITAKYAGGTSAGTGKEYKAKTVDYTLTVKPAPLEPIAGGVIDILDNAWTELTNSDYKTVDAKTAANTGHSNAQYTAQCAGSNSSIQLRSNNSNSGIVSTVSGGLVKRVEIEWNDATSAERTLNIYGSNTPYTNPTDLYDTNKDGDKLGTIVKGTSTHLEISEDYRYIGLRSASGAMYLAKVTITWLPINSKVTVDSEIANGSISVSGAADLNAVAAGTELTLSNTPATGYKLTAYDVYKTDDATTKVTVTDGKFIMPEFDVTISATFEAAKTLNSIEITTPAAQTTFWQTETFNSTGLVVTAHFDGAADEVVTPTVTGSTATAGTQTVTVSFTEGTVTKTATYTITVKAIPNTKETAYSVADAYDIIDKLGTVSGVFISGIISQVDSYNSTYKSITYWISADGTTTKQLQVYGGKGLESADFTAVTDLSVGDQVIVVGNLKKYNSTYEFEANNYLASHTPTTKDPAGLVYATTSYTANVGEAFTTPELTNPHNLVVTYSTSDASKATVDANTGAVTIVAAGVVTITAATTGDATHDAGSASYNITITDPSLAVAQLPFTYNSGKADIETTAGITQEGLGSDYSAAPKLKFDGTGDNIVIRFGSQADELSYDIKGNPGQGTFSGTFAVQESEDGSTYTDLVTYTTLETTTTNKTHKLAPASRYVKFVFTEKSNGNVALGNISITKPDLRAEAGIAWTPATVSLTVGDAFTTPTFSNPNVLAGITFNSDNEALATVDNAGAISLVSGKTGTATITATYDGNETYKAAEATCVINVNPVTDEVVILAQHAGKWYAMMAQCPTGLTERLAALPVEYINGTLYNVAEENKALITWTRAFVDDKVTFQNNGKYLKGKSKTTLILEEGETGLYLWDKDTYTMTIEGTVRTFLYNSEYNCFRNYGASQASNGVAEDVDFSSFPVVTAPVYATGDAYHRDVTPDNYGTICLPNGSSNYTGATFFEIAYRDANGVYLDEVKTLVAGVPYIFQATSTEIALIYEGEAAAAAGSANGLYGTFTEISDVAAVHADKDEYILTGGVIRFCEGSCTVPANRAYIVLLDISTEQTPAPVNRRRVGMSVQGENETTGFEDIFTTEAPVKVIENGQLIIIREGVKYNVQGQKL